MGLSHSRVIGIAGGCAVGLAALVIIVLSVLLRSNKMTATTHTTYARLFGQAVPFETRINVLRTWPKPNQTFIGRGPGPDQASERCFEWLDQGFALYDLCFGPNGRLVRKVLH